MATRIKKPAPAPKAKPKKVEKTEMVKLSELREGDRIKLDNRWRAFALLARSRAAKGHINIMVSNTAKRFFRVKADALIERKITDG
jgi:hypothetical protein